MIMTRFNAVLAITFLKYYQFFKIKLYSGYNPIQESNMRTLRRKEDYSKPELMSTVAPTTQFSPSRSFHVRDLNACMSPGLFKVN